MNEKFQKQIQDSVEAGKRSFGELDFFAESPLCKQTQQMIAEIQRDKLELQAWRLTAQKISMSTPATDVSTPEKFLSAQVVRIAEILDENDRLRKENEGLKQALSKRANKRK